MKGLCGGENIENEEGNPDGAWVLARKPFSSSLA
jgi:hypothetical protein